MSGHPGLHRKVLMAHGPKGDTRRTYWVKDQEPIRISSGVEKKQRVVNPGIHPKERISVSYGMIFSKTANHGVDAAVHAIGQVHTVPKDLLKIKMNVTGSLGGAGGMYMLRDPEIKVSKWAKGHAGIAAHEYGHFLDHNLFGAGGVSGQDGLRGMGTMRRSKELKGLMTAIYKSDAAKQLMGRHEAAIKNDWPNAKRSAEYLLMPAELFARSYAQWVGHHAGGAVQHDTKAFGDQWRQLGNMHAQWDDKDFAPIAKEFDRLFARRGLLNRRNVS